MRYINLHLTLTFDIDLVGPGGFEVQLLSAVSQILPRPTPFALLW